MGWNLGLVVGGGVPLPPTFLDPFFLHDSDPYAVMEVAIEISDYEAGDTFEISVSNNGPGLQAGTAEANPFFVYAPPYTIAPNPAISVEYDQGRLDGAGYFYYFFVEQHAADMSQQALFQVAHLRNGQRSTVVTSNLLGYTIIDGVPPS